MKKFKKTVNNAPTDKKLDALCREVCLARSGNKSDISGVSKEFAVLQHHHIIHKPNHRLRWELSNVVILTKEEHARYHSYEKKVAYDKTAECITRDMIQKFLRIRGTTRENLEMLKRQSGGTDKIALMEYFNQKLKEYKSEVL